jgi:AraC-like DNA-binding protein/mannose-6-phosphate isomerase-like protein (cupin superfamily)
VPLKTFRETIDVPTGQSFRLIRWSRNLREAESLLPDGSCRLIEGEGIHWHHHAEMELTLFTDGEGTRFVGDHIGAFEAGDLVLLGRNLPHYWHAQGESAGISTQWHFPPGHPLWTLPEMETVLAAMRRAEKGLRLGGGTASDADLLLRGMITAGAPSRMAKLMEIFALISSAPDRELESLSSKTFGLSSASRYQSSIDAALRHLIANFRDEIRLPTLLRLSNMSRPTFARQFKEHAGRTVSEFVNELRLQAACRELLETDKSILEIALDCGFNQISFFNRLFRREKGCSPREYRNSGESTTM